MTAPKHDQTIALLILPLLALATMTAVQSAQAQTSGDDVHLIPRHLPEKQPVRQSAGEPSQSSKARPLQVDVNLVLVPVTVTDAKNHPVNDLSMQDFSIGEGGLPQQIRFFSREDAPISVGLILDFSGSMKNKVEYERQAVAQFFANANPEDDYFAILVSSKPKLIATATDSIDGIEEKLASMTPGGGTPLFDAIYLGITRLRSERYKRRALVIISDGGDNDSHYTVKELRREVEESDVITYAIGLFDDLPIPLFKTLEERWGRKYLDEITEVSGGRDIPADNRKKIPEIAGVISRELRSQYVIGYRPSNAEHDGKWRKIKVQVNPAAKPDPMQIHYKKGYYAPDTTYAQAR